MVRIEPVCTSHHANNLTTPVESFHASLFRVWPIPLLTKAGEGACLPLELSVSVLPQGQFEYAKVPNGSIGFQSPKSASYGIAEPRFSVS